MSYVISLALYEKAFKAKGLETAEDIFRLRLPLDYDQLQLEWHEEIRPQSLFYRVVNGCRTAVEFGRQMASPEARYFV